MLTKSHRRRRSVLYVPASRERAVEKALTLGCDAIVFDLEDAVAPEEKPAARERLGRILAAVTETAPEIVVRINPMDSEWGPDDLATALGCGCEAVLLPKVGLPDEITKIAGAMTGAAEIWAMIETPGAILNAGAIAGLGNEPGSRLSCLVAGTNDLVLETGTDPGEERRWLTSWLMQIVLAARAGGLDALDGVFNDFRDTDGFAAECAQGLAMGFDGKTLIHPGQIEAANRAFAPTAEQVAGARTVVAAFARPENAGKGVIALDGRMVERLHLVQAERLLAKADPGAVSD